MKNTVKKIVSLICLIFVILSAAGCSDKNGEGSGESTKSETNADVTNHESNTDSPIHTGSDDDGENFFVDASLFRYDGRANHGCGIDDNQPHMYFTLYYDENIKAFTSPTSFVMPDCDVEITIERWNEYWLYWNER